MRLPQQRFCCLALALYYCFGSFCFLSSVVSSAWINSNPLAVTTITTFDPSPRTATTTKVRHQLLLHGSVSFANEQAREGEQSSLSALDEQEIQWHLMKKYHARGSWEGIWTTYDYIGDVMDETVASVDLTFDENKDCIEHVHSIVVGATRADCATCFDSMQVRQFPVATYTPQNILTPRRRLAACGMVNGPSLLKSSGALATELILSHENARVRVTFQHAPVWLKENNNNDDNQEGGVGAGLPDGLKLFRTMISREALRPIPSTADATNAMNPPAAATAVTDNPAFFRPVPPFDWHKQWAGTSWTWGPNTGNMGWRMEQLSEEDAWHGLAPVQVWNLRLPGSGVFVQCPRVITHETIGLCRLAWLPNESTLLRLEAGLQALQPVWNDQEEEERILGLEAPSLASLRCDVLTKIGELEEEPHFFKDFGEPTQHDTTVSISSSSSLDDNETLAATTTADVTESFDRPTAEQADPESVLVSPPPPPQQPAVQRRNKRNDDIQDARDALQL